MQADARTLLTLVGPLAILYMTYSSVQNMPADGKATDLKPVALGQIGTAPKLPSAETKLRNPFVPSKGSGGGGDPLAEDGEAADPEKSEQPLRLEGTAIVGKVRFAIINGERVSEGDYFRGMRLVKVAANEVTLTGDSQQTVLPLEIAKSDASQVTRPATVATGARAATPSHGGRAKPMPAGSRTAAAKPSSSLSPGGETGALMPGAASNSASASRTGTATRSGAAPKSGVAAKTAPNVAKSGATRH